MIPERMLEVRTHNGEGYKPLVDFKSWRVALMNFKEDFRPERIQILERHPETDEVFVLLRGQVLMILAEGEGGVQELHFQVMEAGSLYNVKPTCWHAVNLIRKGPAPFSLRRAPAGSTSSAPTCAEPRGCPCAGSNNTRTASRWNCETSAP